MFIAPAIDAAKRIVAIQNELGLPVQPERRDALTSEQRTLWNSQFPDVAFEEIAELVH